MTGRRSINEITSNDLDHLYDAIARVRALHQPAGVVAATEFGQPPDCTTCGPNRWPCPTYNAITEDAPAATQATEAEKTTRVFAALHQSAEEDVTRVIGLYERWVKAGPPPLGVSLARWWDKRLVELHAAILPPTDGTGCRCHNGDEVCSGCRRCPDICNGCDGPKYQPTREQ